MLKQIRTLHLYLGALFAPLLVFFAITGMLQMLGLHEGARGEPPPHPWIARAASVHKDGKLALGHHPGSEPFKFFAILMACGLVVTACLGVYMAFKYKNDKRIVIGLLVAGVVLPVVFLYL
jgi:hypothetical protein